MEELKVLVEMVTDLPQMALWVCVGFFVYKVTIIGSVFGIVKIAITKLHNWAITPKDRIITTIETIKVKDICVDGNVFEDIMDTLRGLSKTKYIHERQANDLKKAWDEFKNKKENRDAG